MMFLDPRICYFLFIYLVPLCYVSVYKVFSPSLYGALFIITLEYFLSIPMVCRNMCDKISSKIVVGQSHYSLGKKYCRRCERYMFHEGRFCACCGMQLRTTPVRTQYKVTMKRTEQYAMC
jgi:ribosomal protein L37E